MTRNIPLFKPFIPPREKLMPALEETLYSGYIAQGEKVKEFEKKFGEYIGNPNVVAVSSCTAALHLALILAGVGPGDEVISTPMTAEPTNMAILHTGAKIVWADVNMSTGNMEPDSVREKITDKTKAIVVVHYGGNPADLSRLKQAAYWHDISLIEDCAHALGAKWNNQHVGTVGDFGCFSFQAIKHMTTVEGGILTINPHWAITESGPINNAKRLRWFGIDRDTTRTKVSIDTIGYKYNFNDVLATMGLTQLRHVKDNIRYHRQNGQWYDENLKCGREWHLAGANPSYWFYTIFAEPDHRDRVMKRLREQGIRRRVWPAGAGREVGGSLRRPRARGHARCAQCGHGRSSDSAGRGTDLVPHGRLRSAPAG